MKTIAVVGIDKLRKKNLYQFNGMARQGYRFLVFAIDPERNSKEVSQNAIGVTVYTFPQRWRRPLIAISIAKCLLKRSIDIAEVYPFSYTNLALSFLLRLFKIPLIVIARGEEYYFLSKEMRAFKRVAFRATYLLASHVIYKEPYMLRMFPKCDYRKMTMIPNAVGIPECSNHHKENKCHFLFLNSFRSMRYPELALEAFLGVCEELGLDGDSAIRLDIVGLLGNSAPTKVAEREARLKRRVEKLNIPARLHPWTATPEEWLDSADVFLLPSKVVFLNYSLLEAMSRGVPAIVAASEGSDLIVTHGVDGFVLPLQRGLWKESMLQLIRNVGLRNRMGLAAREKVRTRYSLAEYNKAYDGVYKSLLRNA